jgi:hypothetical protein
MNQGGSIIAAMAAVQAAQSERASVRAAMDLRVAQTAARDLPARVPVALSWLAWMNPCG